MGELIHLRRKEQHEPQPDSPHLERLRLIDELLARIRAVREKLQ